MNSKLSPAESTVLSHLKELTPNQMNAFVKAMDNPYFFLIAFRLAVADERNSDLIFRFARGLTST